jgi:hypothetical protein
MSTVQHLSQRDDKKDQEVEMIEDKSGPDLTSLDAQDSTPVVETCFEGYTLEETQAMSKKLVRLIDFRVLPVLILLFLVSLAHNLYDSHRGMSTILTLSDGSPICFHLYPPCLSYSSTSSTVTTSPTPKSPAWPPT